MATLNLYAPIKKKMIRGNSPPYMTKVLRKAIMKRSYLANKYYKNRSSDEETTYKKHTNFVSRLYKRERKAYYNNLNSKDVTDNKKFWKTIKPFLVIKVFQVVKLI